MTSFPPFFSILVPTKNRAHLVTFAVQSVLDQSFQDFEIIVVDNDDTDATKKVIGAFTDPRIKYYRTGGLNMSENWEFALDKARGKYVTVLEDKQAYYPWALRRVKELLKESGAAVVVWEWDVFDDKARRAQRKVRSRNASNVSAEQILSIYTSKPNAAWRYLPRMLNSCASRELIFRIKAHPSTGRFFDELSPDLCAAFYLLATVENVCLLNDGLGLLGYMHQSNALKVVIAKAPMEFYGGVKTLLQSAVKHVPIKSFRLVHNTVYNDYLRIRGEFGGGLVQYEMSTATYLKLCLGDLLKNGRRGAWNRADIKMVSHYALNAPMTLRDAISVGFFILATVAKRLVRGGIKPPMEQTWYGDDILQAVKKCLPSP